MARRPSPKKTKAAPPKSVKRPPAKKAAAARKPSPAKAAPAKAASKPLPAKSGKWVYAIGGGKAEGKSQMRDLLGGKGANLAEMANLGLPVPPGFTITTGVCTHYYANGQKYPKELESQVASGLAHIARITGKAFGDKSNP